MAGLATAELPCRCPLPPPATLLVPPLHGHLSVCVPWPCTLPSFHSHPRWRAGEQPFTHPLSCHISVGCTHSQVRPPLWAGTALHPPPGPAALACLHASLGTNPATWCPGTCCPGRSWHILTPKGAIPRKERKRRRRHREPCCSCSPRESEEFLPCLGAGHRQGPLP